MREFDSKAIIKSLGQVGFAEGRIFDRSMLERAEYELKQQYLSKGKYGVEVTSTVTPLPRNRVGVSFDVFEGSVARIQEIRFVGNKAFSESDLLDEMKLTTPGWLTWYTDTDKYSREKLEGDLERLRSYYLDRGYLEFSVEPRRSRSRPTVRTSASPSPSTRASPTRCAASSWPATCSAWTARSMVWCSSSPPRPSRPPRPTIRPRPSPTTWANWATPSPTSTRIRSSTATSTKPT